jgi:hypothetical protein
MTLYKNTLPGKQDLSLDEAYTCCTDLPFWAWVKVTTTKDLKYLIKSGTVPVEELYSIWDKINDEYRTLSGDTDSNHTFELYKDMHILDREIMTITSIVNQLRILRNPELIDMLQNVFGFSYEYVDLDNDLNKTITGAKARVMDLKLKEKEYNDIVATEDKQNELTEFDFIEQLVVLSEDIGYEIRMDAISVAQYIAYYNKFKAKVLIKLSHV